MNAAVAESVVEPVAFIVNGLPLGTTLATLNEPLRVPSAVNVQVDVKTAEPEMHEYVPASPAAKFVPDTETVAPT